ncbi:KAP family NTPase [Clavibacter michiganensis subsp. phaseoli]|uniref:KAP family P-loop NTPase fold protein n=1 Tax=Clavibacter phaseoli TaxID=1734031 RepID=UPI001FB1C998|nr:KAP family NTPase [Clavibacter phaseoli]MCJ1712504.1 KAP family NTPase [Clavibacter phaseoli]
MGPTSTPPDTHTFPLWSDEPANTDLLAFRAVAETVADAIFDDALDPIAVGLSGAWGSGKTSVLELVVSEIDSRSASADGKVLVVPTQPWRYDPTVGPKESLIAEVLGALSSEFQATDPAAKTAIDTLKKLARKVNWTKAIKMAARTAITLQLPQIDDVFGLVSDDPDSLDGEKGMAEFREQFQELLADPALDHVSRVVVLVDDLDRCLPDTVVETLEAIRLFLSAKGMSFVIAADEERVAEAIQQKFHTADGGQDEESPAKLYLHKIVQTTIPVPALSRFDTEAYLFLLLAKIGMDDAKYTDLIRQCDELRLTAPSLDSLAVPDGSPLVDHLITASRLTPILYEKFQGNPRRIKRFLNDLNVRQSIARRRGFTLAPDAVAKLMVLERILTEDFAQVLDWLATNQLRDKLDALELAANGPSEKPAPEDESETQAQSEPAPVIAEVKVPVRAKRAVVPVEEVKPAPAPDEGFSDTMRRWAKLPPVLDAAAITGYLYLAASFAKIEVIDTGLPERLRDMAAALTSSLKLDRSGITDEALRALPEGDARTLVSFLGRRTRDQPSIQKFSVESLIRIATTQPAVTSDVISALRSIRSADVEAATVVKLRALDKATYGVVLEAWKSGATLEPVVNAIRVVETGWATNGH